MTKSSNSSQSHWRLIVSLLAGAIIGSLVAHVWSLSFSTGFIIGWDCAILIFIGTIVVMLKKDTMHEHLNNAQQSMVSILSLVTASSFICVYAIAKQTQIGKHYQHVMLALSMALTITTIFIAWLMIQLIFALQYAYLYFSEAQKGHVLPIAFPEALGSSVETGDKTVVPSITFADFFYGAVAIGTSGQTADMAFTSKAGRVLATLHCIIAFAFNLVIISLLINIIASYL